MRQYSCVGFCEFGVTCSAIHQTDTENNLIQYLARYHDEGYTHAIVTDALTRTSYWLDEKDLAIIYDCYCQHFLGRAYTYLFNKTQATLEV